MSIGPMGGIFASASGAPGAQINGAEVERTKQDTTQQKRARESNELANNAAGIAKPDGQDHQTNDRDADGRRLWEFTGKPMSALRDESSPDATPSKDASGNCGNSLDLTG